MRAVSNPSYRPMVTMQPTPSETSDVEFCQECRRKAQYSDTPAWEFAESEWVHQDIKPKRTKR